MNSKGNGHVAKYTYDYLGRRVTKTTYDTNHQPLTTVQYVYDGDQIIAEYDGSNNLLRKYVYGPGIDEPVAMITASGTKYYYHFDGLGSVIALSNISGGIVERYSYDVYGEPNRVSAVGNPYMFTGRAYDPNTGLYDYRARYYKPSIGRFLQTDPIGYSGGLNIYTYCGNNPINWIDPWGEAKRQKRPLNRPGLRHITAGRFHHDSFRYNNGTNSSYYDDSRVRSDDAPKYLQDRYKDVGPELDDNILREAEDNLRQEWDRGVNPNAPIYDWKKHNCQDYCDAVEEECYKLSQYYED